MDSFHAFVKTVLPKDHGDIALPCAEALGSKLDAAIASYRRAVKNALTMALNTMADDTLKIADRNKSVAEMTEAIKKLGKALKDKKEKPTTADTIQLLTSIMGKPVNKETFQWHSTICGAINGLAVAAAGLLGVTASEDGLGDPYAKLVGARDKIRQILMHCMGVQAYLGTLPVDNKTQQAVDRKCAIAKYKHQLTTQWKMSPDEPFAQFLTDNTQP